jgi:hypothetical protein
MEYGLAPYNVGHFPLKCTETLYYQSMPVKLPGDISLTVGDQRLERFLPMLHAVRDQFNYTDWLRKYVYLTAKHTWVGPGAAPNRPGWHSDGYLTSDVSYLWFDSVPTVFNTSTFTLTPDHAVSMEEMHKQADPRNTQEAPCFHLLCFDPAVIHAVGEVKEPGMRTFVKIVVSERQYNLAGNTRNYALDYYWEDQPRNVERNDPSK